MKKTRVIPSIIISLFIIFGNANAQDEWGYVYGRSDFNETAWSIAVDNNNNSVIVGRFSDTLDTDPYSTGGVIISNGYVDSYLQKVDPYGIPMWTISWGGTDYDEALDVEVDSAGNIYVLGLFKDSVDFNPGIGDSIIYFGSQIGTYFTKFSPNGDFIWTRAIDSNSKFLNFLTLDSDNNVIVCGTFKGVVDFDPGNGVFLQTSTVSTWDHYIAKYDSTGSFLWCNSLVDSGTQIHASELKTDKFGNVFCSGRFADSIAFSSNPNDKLYSNGDSGFFVKYNGGGQVVTKFKLGSELVENESVIFSFSVDDSSNYYLSGRFKTTIDIDPGPGVLNLTPLEFSPGVFRKDGVIIKTDSIGNLIWGKQISSNDDFYLGRITLNDNSLFITATCRDTLFNDVNTPFSGYSKISGLALIAYDFDGNNQWVESIQCDSLYISYLNDVKVNQQDDIFITGAYNGYIDLSINSPSNPYPTQFQQLDSYVAKFNGCYITDPIVDVSNNVLEANTTHFEYQWIDCANNNAIIGENTNLFTPSDNGNYALVVTNNGCTDTSECVVINTIGIESMLLSNHRVFPNPTTGQITIDLDELKGVSHVVVCDYFGTELEKHEITNMIELGVGPGAYFIRFIDVNGLELGRLNMIRI